MQTSDVSDTRDLSILLYPLLRGLYIVPASTRSQANQATVHHEKVNLILRTALTLRVDH